MTSITIAYGDGTGPETFEAALSVLREAGAEFSIESVELGGRVYNMDWKSGVPPYAWDSINRTNILLKAPTLLPMEEGYEDVSNVIIATRNLKESNIQRRYCYMAQPFSVAISDEPLADDTRKLFAAARSHVSEQFAFFEPIGEAMVQMKGMDIANPSSALLASIMLLSHLGQKMPAALVHNAWMKTLEDGIHTPDIYIEGVSVEKTGTRGFADAVIARLGQKPKGIIFNVNQPVAAA